jgi:O-antigen biosynthesis protein
MTLSCSVVVCSRERPRNLEDCLSSLGRLDSPPTEVIVVDNSSGNPAAANAARTAGARYVVEAEVGLSRARNTGAAAAEGELVAFLDDDCVVEPAWLREHVAAHASQDVAVTTGRILPVGGGSQPGAATLLDAGASRLRIDRATPHWFELANFGGVGFGGNMVLRRNLFIEGFRFRESLGLGTPIGGAEEVYAFFSLVRDGHAIAYVPTAVVAHTTSPPARGDVLEGARRYGAYLTLLFVEEPGFRGAIVKQVVEGATRTPRPWRRSDETRDMPGQIRRALSMVRGAGVYARERIRHAAGAGGSGGRAA